MKKLFSFGAGKQNPPVKYFFMENNYSHNYYKHYCASTLDDTHCNIVKSVIGKFIAATFHVQSYGLHHKSTPTHTYW